jgi:two-component system sensor histidine kinase DctS
VFDSVHEQEELASFLTNNICDYSISGLLLAKVSRAKELGIQLHIDRGSCLKDIPQKWEVGILVSVIGNLLENAMEALQGQALERRKIECAIRDLADELRIEIKDNGPGIPKQIRDQIYKQGFTTKGSKNRGIGLALIHRYVENVGGRIDLETEVNLGTIFTVIIPK